MESRKQFEKLSVLAEKILMDFGISGHSTDGKASPCTGELLHSVLWYHEEIMAEFCDENADEIVAAIGDRTTKLDGSYPCIGMTSHATAGVLIDNLYFEFASPVLNAIASDSLPSWSDLKSEQRQAIASLETAERNKTSGWHELAHKLRTERILYLKSLRNSPPIQAIAGNGSTAYPPIWSDAIQWILTKHEAGEDKFRQSELTLWAYQRDSSANVYPFLRELEGHRAIGPEHAGNYWKTFPGMHALDTEGSEFTFAPDLRQIFPDKLQTITARYGTGSSEASGRKPDVEPQEPDNERWSIGRFKADWIAMKFMTKDQWDAMRKANPERIQSAKGNKRLWQFKKSLCEERGFHCPEFAEK